MGFSNCSNMPSKSNIIRQLAYTFFFTSSLESQASSHCFYFHVNSVLVKINIHDQNFSTMPRVHDTSRDRNLSISIAVTRLPYCTFQHVVDVQRIMFTVPLYVAPFSGIQLLEMFDGCCIITFLHILKRN